MADEKQVARLKRSVDEWNLWYGKLFEPYLGKAVRRANLSGANLSGADLTFANLSNADLSGADLRGAILIQTNLTEANLLQANLSGAGLNGADLNGADLLQANLSGAAIIGVDFIAANLREANLRGADLSIANLIEANLLQANFTRSIFDHTIFAEIDLSTVQGLEAAIHKGPSTVNINSVMLPYDEPTCRHFLRGVGFTETQIDYLPSLLTPRPIQYQSLFISYAHEDEVIARRLHTDLQKKDVPCWFAPHDLRPGTPILRGIEEAIHLRDRFLLILSQHAINSRWIEREVDAALHQEIRRGQDVLFPIRLDNAVLESNAGWATRLQHRHIGDFTGWQEEQCYQEAFALLLRHLKTEEPSPPHQVP